MLATLEVFLRLLEPVAQLRKVAIDGLGGAAALDGLLAPGHQLGTPLGDAVEIAPLEGSLDGIVDAFRRIDAAQAHDQELAACAQIGPVAHQLPGVLRQFALA